MANTILITANWHTGALSQQTISRQYDNNRYVVQFVSYPEASEGNELDYYLLVWMSSAPGEKPDEIAPIQLASDQWYISNVFTQQTQQIKFQMCALNTEGTFEAHSPIFTGFVRNSLDHDGTTQDIDVSTLFDAYREYLNELIIRSGAVVIDSVPTQGSTNAVSSGGVWNELSGIREYTKNILDINLFNVNGITVSDGEVSGTANTFYSRFYTNGISVDCVDNTQYTLSGKAKTDGVGGNTGNGLTIRFRYTDQTISSALPLSNTWVEDYHTFKATSEAGKTVEAVLIGYSSLGSNTWHLKELQIEAGTVNTSYEPHVSAVDRVARYSIENLNNKFSAVDKIGEKTETIYSDFYGRRIVSVDNFEFGNLAIPEMVYASSTTRIRTKEGVTIPLKQNDIVSLSTGVFYYGYYDSEGTIHSGNRWVSELTVPENGEFVFAMRYSTEADITDFDAFVSGFSISTKGADMRNNTATAIDLFRTDRYYDHLLLNKTSGENVIIPLQSISSIYMSKRLGFKVLEANVVNTSDGYYIVTHGDAGKFGNYFEHVDGETDISATAINSVTLDWIKTNVRYKSLYPKYRTAPPTLEEYLAVCKTLKMIPLVQVTNREGVASVADAIMGKDNYIAYNGNRRLNKGMIMIWRNITTKEGIIAECEKYGLPLMYGMDKPTVFTDEELTDIVETLHNKGIIIGFQDTYISGAVAQKYFQMGFDFCATTWEINDFMSGNIYNKVSDIDFSDFETNGTMVDENLVLTNNQYVRVANQDSNFLSGVICYIRFSGALDIRICDGFRTNAYTSDGSNYVRVSAGALVKAPNIAMTATTTTTIYEIKCMGSKL